MPEAGEQDTPPGAGLVVARNALYNVGAQVWLVLVALVATPYVVRELGVDAYGLYVLLLTVGGYLAFLDLGLNVATVKYLSEYHGRDRDDLIGRLMGTTIGLYLIVGLIGGAAVALSASFLVANVLSIPDDLTSLARTSLWIVAVGFVLNVPSVAFMSVPIALQRMDLVGRRNALVGTATMLGAVLVLALGYGLLAILVVQVAIAFAATLSWFLTARRLLPTVSLAPRIDSDMARRLTRFGFLKVLYHAATYSVFHIDKLLLAALASLSAVAYYSVPVNLAQRVVYVVGAISAAAFPAASYLHARADQERLAELYLRGMKFVGVLTIPTASLLFIYAHSILAIWIDPSFADEAGDVLRLVAVAYLAIAFSVLPGVTADALGRPGMTAAFSIAMLVVNLVLSLILIPRFEAVGAAVAVAVNASVLVPVFAHLVHRQIVGVSSSRVLRFSLLRPAIAGVCCWPVMVALERQVDGVASLLLALAGSFAAYVLVSFLIGTYDAEDRRVLSRAWRLRGA